MMGVGLPLHSIMKFENTRILTKQNISFSQKMLNALLTIGT